MQTSKCERNPELPGLLHVYVFKFVRTVDDVCGISLCTCLKSSQCWYLITCLCTCRHCCDHLGQYWRYRPTCWQLFFSAAFLHQWVQCPVCHHQWRLSARHQHGCEFFWLCYWCRVTYFMHMSTCILYHVQLYR